MTDPLRPAWSDLLDAADAEDVRRAAAYPPAPCAPLGLAPGAPTNGANPMIDVSDERELADLVLAILKRRTDLMFDAADRGVDVDQLLAAAIARAVLERLGL